MDLFSLELRPGRLDGTGAHTGQRYGMATRQRLDAAAWIQIGRRRIGFDFVHKTGLRASLAYGRGLEHAATDSFVRRFTPIRPYTAQSCPEMTLATQLINRLISTEGTCPDLDGENTPARGSMRQGDTHEGCDVTPKLALKCSFLVHAFRHGEPIHSVPCNSRPPVGKNCTSCVALICN
jgi:hypothetical protein